MGLNGAKIEAAARRFHFISSKRMIKCSFYMLAETKIENILVSFFYRQGRYTLSLSRKSSGIRATKKKKKEAVPTDC